MTSLIMSSHPREALAEPEDGNAYLDAPARGERQAADAAAIVDALAKRTVDVIGSACILLLLAPLLVVVAIAIKVSSPGPVLFRQARYGQGGRIFSICKFRTMVGPSPKCIAIGDPDDHEARLTPLGRILRRYCIDELPQLLNVLAGDMSLVGPRAHPVGLHVLQVPYEDVVPNYHHRHSVRPGMTGLAQVMGFHGIVDSVEHAQARQAYDVLYIQRRNTDLDVALIAFTGWRFLLRGGRGASRFPIQRFLPTQLGSATPPFASEPASAAPAPCADGLSTFAAS
ncbi:sugar transferase [Methylobacterium sp. 4-46]|uniref:sugar transferase n=1 Tax=unclassified Methylobacterium TaxID=2615210 RepID=UPI000152D7ED|nr:MULTISPECIES: sugar transferase [Methylobacterium]ACA18395.1 sugar transferase [Methylobacterium sp. 4-46]WFT77685.1 sugar transferase [Methylobacterium nodulans]